LDTLLFISANLERGNWGIGEVIYALIQDVFSLVQNFPFFEIAYTETALFYANHYKTL